MPGTPFFRSKRCRYFKFIVLWGASRRPIHYTCIRYSSCQMPLLVLEEPPCKPYGTMLCGRGKQQHYIHCHGGPLGKFSPRLSHASIGAPWMWDDGIGQLTQQLKRIVCAGVITVDHVCIVIWATHVVSGPGDGIDMSGLCPLMGSD